MIALNVEFLLLLLSCSSRDVWVNPSSLPSTHGVSMSKVLFMFRVSGLSQLPLQLLLVSFFLGMISILEGAYLSLSLVYALLFSVTF